MWHCRTLRGCVDWNLIPLPLAILIVGRTLRGCVDWNLNPSASLLACWVAPYVGAWIETRRMLQWWFLLAVAPYVGAWIETVFCFNWCKGTKSHPTWVRGLKLHPCQLCFQWFCRTLRGCVDWNFVSAVLLLFFRSRTLRGCVDWNFKVSKIKNC